MAIPSLKNPPSAFYSPELPLDGFSLFDKGAQRISRDIQLEQVQREDKARQEIADWIQGQDKFSGDAYLDKAQEVSAKSGNLRDYLTIMQTRDRSGFGGEEQALRFAASIAKQDPEFAQEFLRSRGLGQYDLGGMRKKPAIKGSLSGGLYRETPDGGVEVIREPRQNPRQGSVTKPRYSQALNTQTNRIEFVDFNDPNTQQMFQQGLLLPPPRPEKTDILGQLMGGLGKQPPAEVAPSAPDTQDDGGFSSALSGWINGGAPKRKIPLKRRMP